MKAIIVCTSVSHGNTRRVAEEMGAVLGADVVAPGEVGAGELAGYDLVGFGSGIFNRRIHPEMRRFVGDLAADGAGRQAFAFATSGLPGPRLTPLVRGLERKGFAVGETFACRGFDTWLPFKLVGGIRRNRPGPDDLAAARAYAERLKAVREDRG
ncbi:flavodoxin [Mangrovactinospora gilvigrisea]|uniref:Flavodoxin n=1 Tax=Mangrovactinospora gilvigrisea TaxID=1428644 RepID=A0A1J7CBT5_9ACTN|nr:flavodoxin family protein [Mangrovactinospora gilvigrisea]OIV37122.1 flavodoxin [Mangrovactinospora gilvigrisea]